jgi:glycosyltransferase involved in cell wall biosynthesis
LCEANSALALGGRERLVVSTIRLVPGGGWEHLLAAWPSVVARVPHARLWLAGPCPDRAAAVQQIALLGLAEQVLLVGVFADPEVLLSAADLCVMPALEGSPLALLEAMAAELPSVATDVANHRYLATDGLEALLVPAADPQALGAAIVRLLEDSELATRLGQAARSRAESNFSLAGMVEQHLSLFDRLT